MTNRRFFRIIAGIIAASLLLTSGCMQKTTDSEAPEQPVTASIESPSEPEKTSGTDTASDTDTQSDSDKTSDSDSDTASDPDTDTSEKAELVTVFGADGAHDITLTAGDKLTLTADIKPTSEAPVWSSSDKAIASVDENGTVTAKKAGECTITLTVKSNKDLNEKFTFRIKDNGNTAASSKAQSTASQQTAAQQPQQQTTVYYPEEQTQTAASSTQPESEPEPEKPHKVTSIKLTFPSAILTVGQTVTPEITLSPQPVDNSDVTLTTSDESIVTINDDGSVTAVSEGSCTITAIPASDPSLSAEEIIGVSEPYVPEDHGELPREECYIDGILIVNKTYSLPRSYNPGGLTPETSAAFERMRQGAAQDGINLWIVSGFRSYDYQSSLYWNYVSYSGQAAADTYSARPGHSEHQTGMAIDLNSVYDSFAWTAEAAWIEAHCHEYGFILRYPQGKQSVTGYKYEPWHVRYIGDKATEIYESGLTLEEYYGITSEYDY